MLKNLKLSLIVLCNLIVIFILLLFSSFNGIGFAKKMFDTKDRNEINVNEFKFLVDKVAEFHVEPIDKKTINLHAINGILSSMDPHSVLFSKEEFKDLVEQVDGEFGGIGVELEWRRGAGFLIITALDDLPAELAGIKSNDLMIAINDEMIEAIGYSKALSNLKGMPGTKVKVTVLRIDENGARKKIDLTITRAIIKANPVKYFIDNNIAYIRIISFDKNTFDEFRKIIIRLQPCGIKGILLDLTNNPGGVVDAANKIVDLFIKEGKIVSIKGKGSGDLEYVANPDNLIKYTDIPLVIMINESTASAAEIVAAALQDHHRAIIIGRRSFGKGSVQTVFELNKNYGIKITTALHHRPNGKTIQGKGVDPDIIVKKMNIKLDKDNNDDEDFFRPSESLYKNYIKPKDDIDHIDEELESKQSNNILDKENNTKNQKNKSIIKKSNSESVDTLIASEIEKNNPNKKNTFLKCKSDDSLVKNQTPRDKLNRFIEKNMYIRGFDILQSLIISSMYKTNYKTENKSVK